MDGDENFIYVTSNGNDWELQNLDKENDTYKRFFRKEELQSLLNNKNVKVSII
jgi:DNA transposition AAA+ family ATPase